MKNMVISLLSSLSKNQKSLVKGCQKNHMSVVLTSWHTKASTEFSRESTKKNSQTTSQTMNRAANQPTNFLKPRENHRPTTEAR
jgi:hypothetical protein